MAPVWLSLFGSGLDRATVALIGWFGPRGLASVVFALLALGELAPADGDRALVTITTVVALSVLFARCERCAHRRQVRRHPSRPDSAA